RSQQSARRSRPRSSANVTGPWPTSPLPGPPPTGALAGGAQYERSAAKPHEERQLDTSPGGRLVILRAPSGCSRFRRRTDMRRVILGATFVALGVVGVSLFVNAQQRGGGSGGAAPAASQQPGTKLPLDELKKQMFRVSAGRRLKPSAWPNQNRVAVAL